jgi:hypothetical protein
MTAKEEPQNWLETFYKDLQTLVDTTFPKKCNKCGRVYSSKQEFLAHTEPVKNIKLEDNSGLFALEGGDAETTIGVFRNCECGTTLMADFQDRRDNSAAGKARRDQFEKLLVTLVEHGMESPVAREELLRVLHGEQSEAIANLLGHVKL